MFTPVSPPRATCGRSTANESKSAPRPRPRTRQRIERKVPNIKCVRIALTVAGVPHPRPAESISVNTQSLVLGCFLINNPSFLCDFDTHSSFLSINSQFSHHRPEPPDAIRSIVAIRSIIAPVTVTAGLHNQECHLYPWCQAGQQCRVD